ncbi:hypothetical protein DFH06DRAFT_1129022 [Mycena polygramma]|nr:hypothetical protein DFH06DRAFT_1129022 [Mycena polygramma]
MSVPYTSERQGTSFFTLSFNVRVWRAMQNGINRYRTMPSVVFWKITEGTVDIFESAWGHEDGGICFLLLPFCITASKGIGLQSRAQAIQTATSEGFDLVRKFPARAKKLKPVSLEVDLPVPQWVAAKTSEFGGCKQKKLVSPVKKVNNIPYADASPG